MKFLFVEQDKQEVIYLDPVEGRFDTGYSGAPVEYEFDSEDATIRLTIEGMWFGREDIDELIDFLTAAKTNLKGD